MTKRPSLIAGLKVVPPADAPAASSSPESAAPRQAKPAGRKPRPDIVHTSVYLPRPVYKRLREIAFTTDQKIHDVIMEGVDAALKKYGHPGVEALKAETRK
jgi:hypothetical protein